MHSLRRFRFFLAPATEQFIIMIHSCHASARLKVEMTCVDFTKPAIKDLKRFRFELYAFLMAKLELDVGLAEGGEVFRT